MKAVAAAGNAGSGIRDDEGMHVVLTLVGIVTVVIAVAGLCSRLDLPSPLVLIVVGVIGSYLPFVPDVQLEPEVVLFGLLPPLLYAAALQTSLVDFNANRRAILLLSVGLVAFTTVGVAVLVHALLPDLGWCRGLRDRCRRRAAGRGGRDRDRPPHRPASPHRHDPRGRVAAQRRDRPGRAEHGDRAATVAVAWQVVARDFLVAAGGGVARRAGVLLRHRLRPQARDRPGDRQRPELPDPVRGVRRRRGDPRLRRASASSSPGCCSVTSRRSCRPPSPGSPSG